MHICEYIYIYIYIYMHSKITCQPKLTNFTAVITCEKRDMEMECAVM